MPDQSRKPRQAGATEIVEAQAAGAVLVQRKVRLAVSAGPDRGKQVVMDGDRLSIGSHPQNGLVLTDQAVSRHHAELRISPRGLVLRDLGSTNGTVANGLMVHEVLLPLEAELRVGETQIQVSVLGETVSHPLVEQNHLGALLGTSPIMRALFAKILRAAATESTVLFEGESGTGKELAAHALHDHSPRKDGPFIVVDCGALPRSLIESELFGHERGAFTGATHSRQGAFEQAHGGTIFLDEIGELDLDLQPRLLRALESRSFKRVGGSNDVKVDIRVIAGTNRQLERQVAEGEFREDLFYRLAVLHLTLPPLRERREDIPLLAKHFIDQVSRDRGTPCSIPPETMERLKHRPWPGNVRQLRNTVDRYAVMNTLGGEESSIVAFVEQTDPNRQPEGAETSVDTYARPEVPYKIARAGLLERFERTYLTALLEKHEGNLTQSARGAEIDRVYLLRLLDKYDMRKQRKQA